MAKSKKSKSKSYNSFQEVAAPVDVNVKKPFSLTWKHPVQKLAWGIYRQHDIMFMIGSAGTGKSHLAMAFAIEEILNRTKKKIILTRPVIEAGENLGFLPGDLKEKLDPYMMPLWDILNRIVGPTGQHREIINEAYEVAPLAFMRGRTFHDSICILDEAQNCTKAQLKLFLTRMGENSKMIITGDPKQSDIGIHEPDLVDVVYRLESLKGVGVVQFNEECIVRHPMVGQIIKRLEK